jgi:hypothetical protein
MRPIQTPSRPTTHRVDAGQHLDRVAGPGGDLGGRDARVEPPGDPGVAQVVGRFISGEASCSGVSEAARTFCHSCHQVDGWSGFPLSERNSLPSRGGPVLLDVRAADLGAWLCFQDESGQGLRPPKGRTWGRRGRTPVVTVTGGHNTWVSLAALIACLRVYVHQVLLPRAVACCCTALSGDAHASARPRSSSGASTVAHNTAAASASRPSPSALPPTCR